MKKKILIVACFLLVLLGSVLAFADGLKNKWSYVPVRGKRMWVYSEAASPVVVRWDYYTLDDNGKIVIKAPGEYPGAYEDDAFNGEDFPLLPNENFILPPSVWNFYVKVPSDRVKVEGFKITITD